MKYKVSIYGYGVEVTIGTPTNKQIEIILDENSEESISSRVFDFDDPPHHEIDEQLHKWGCLLDYATIIVTDENEVEVLNTETGLGLEILEQDENFSYCEYNYTKIDETKHLLMCVSNEKGSFFEGEFECDQFDIRKFKLIVEEEAGMTNFCVGDIISQVTYDGEWIDNWGGDTSGKSFDVFINFDKSDLREIKLDKLV